MKLKDIDDQQLVPEGDYQIKLKKMDNKVSSKGNNYLACEYTIANGEYTGRSIFDNITVTNDAVWRIKRWLYAFGNDEVASIEPAKGEKNRYIIDQQGFADEALRLIRGKIATARVIVHRATEEEKSLGYGDKNNIKVYLAPESNEPIWS